MKFVKILPRQTAVVGRARIRCLPLLAMTHGVSLATLVIITLAARVDADTYTFSNGGGNSQYTTGNNWVDTSVSPNTTGTVPNLSTGNTAQINSPAAVNYTPGGDLLISNGGVLEISNGSFTQVGGNNYIQLGSQGSGTGTGNGTVLVDGGTFNQGTDSASPFNLTGTGNVFTVSNGGTANINTAFNAGAGMATTISNGTLNVTGGGINLTGTLTVSNNATVASTGQLNVNAGGGLSVTGGIINIASGSFQTAGTFNMSGGSINVASGSFQTAGTFNMTGGSINVATSELDFNGNSATLNGGTITAKLITGVNGTGASVANPHVFNISAGALTLTSNNANSGGIYSGGSTEYVNFTPNSTGVIEFLAATGDSTKTVDDFISSNKIEYNNTVYDPSDTTFSNFSVTTDSAGDVFLTLASISSVPEPVTVDSGVLLLGFTLPVAVRRLWRLRAKA